jgi:hypothetical protein
MAGMAGLGGSISHNAAGLLGDKAGMFGANMGLGAAANPVATYLNSPELAQQFATKFGPPGLPATVATNPASSAGFAAVEKLAQSPEMLAQSVAEKAGAAAAAPTTVAAGPMAKVGGGAQFTGGMGSRFGQAVRTGLPGGTPGIITKNAPMIAGIGALSNISDASQPKLNKYDPNKDEGYDWNYEGSYRPMPRRFDPTVEGEGEIQFFDEVNPIGYLTASGERRGYAEGGDVKKEDSGVDADQALRWSLANRSVGLSDAERERLWRDEYYNGGIGFDKAFDPTNFTQRQLQYGMNRDPITGGVGGITPGSYYKQMGGGIGNMTSIGGHQFRLNDKYEWEYIKPPAAPATGGGGGGGGGGGVKPPEDKVTVTDTLKTTIDPTKGGVTPGTGTGATLTDRPDIPGATYDSPGVQTLKDLYTPKFTQKDDFVTDKRDPYTMGSELSAKLPEATARYQTSPGAITASRTYAGGSPSERIRAAAQANAAARAAAAAAAGTTTPSTTATTSTTPGTGGELDFGIPKTTSTAGPANTAGPASDRGYTGLSGNNPYMNIYNQQTNQQPNLNAGNVMDTGNEGGEMDFGFGFGPPAQGQTNPNVNLASLIGTDAFFEELSKRYGGGGGNAEYGMPNNPVLAAGGPVNMHNGAFVVDARTVSELGNGSSNAGIELLQRLGGQPVRGRGDGVSDSVPARIGGKQEARVARDEVIFQPKAVKRLGGGSAKRGTQKLYAMMEKAHKARKRAGRGQDTKLAKGLV